MPPFTREKKGEDDGAKYNLEKKSAKFILTISIFLECYER
jgi:hypothetical protein